MSSALTDILLTYIRPLHVVECKLTRAPSDRRAAAYLFAGCLVYLAGDLAAPDSGKLGASSGHSAGGLGVGCNSRRNNPSAACVLFPGGSGKDSPLGAGMAGKLAPFADIAVLGQPCRGASGPPYRDIGRFFRSFRTSGSPVVDCLGNSHLVLDNWVIHIGQIALIMGGRLPAATRCIRKRPAFRGRGYQPQYRPR